ncbi:hypothetical protein PGTUg99_019844 [Puccinia graminis f. sp. tritici]|uniref:Uncharacterized protein n=1 Tax=Puccinia graminis f. sp. tritici TaxID=56615 RepID=A0A5B0R8S6_PUCGR|nr:hypothetical protein PGTUg99_019844 [Puccinia graminis f. sp. tritici]
MLARIVAACLIGSLFIFISAYESGPEQIGYELTLSGTEPTQKIPEKCRCEAEWQKTTASQPFTWNILHAAIRSAAAVQAPSSQVASTRIN